MPRTNSPNGAARAAPRDHAEVHEIVNRLGNAPANVRDTLLAAHFGDDPGVRDAAIGILLDQRRAAGEALRQADEELASVQRTIQDLTRPPLLEAGVLAVYDDRTCLVSVGGQTRQQVAIHPDLEASAIALQVGDAVGLSPEGHVVVSRIEQPPRGRVATVRGWQGGELIVEYQAEHRVTATPAAAVAAAAPQRGDRVLVHEAWQIVLAVLPREQADELDDAFEPAGLDQVGGLDEQIDEVLTAVEARLLMPERALELGLGPLGGLVLEGPPGTGKTLLVRALVTHLRAHHGLRVRFINVAPGSWRDPFYGVADQKVVEPVHRASRLLEEGQADLVVLFYDELDTLGTRSGEVSSRIDARVLSSLLAAIDGVADGALRRGMLFVGATNRTDLIDEALLRPNRFGDLVIKVPRPDREAARAVLRCHVRPEHLYLTGAEEDDQVDSRTMAEHCIEAALGRLFRDADPADALVELVLAGGQRRFVHGRDVVSGALLANLAQRARRLALRRGLIGPRGLVPDDFARAADDELDSLAERLRDPWKAREVLDDRTLPVTQCIPRRRERA